MSMGDFATGVTLNRKFTTIAAATGAPTSLAGTPAISIYKDNSVTQSTTGITLSTDFDGVTGLNNVNIDTSSDGTFYSAGSNFDIVITTGTVGGTSVVGYVIDSFNLFKEAGNLNYISNLAVSGNNATLNLKQLNISNSAGDALVAASTGSNGQGINATGNGTGSGILSTGGATGRGANLVGGATSGVGLRAAGTAGNSAGVAFAGQGSGAGLDTTGGATGAGAKFNGGATSGEGILTAVVSGNGATFAGATNGHGAAFTGAGTGEGGSFTGGATGHGIEAIGGATSGNGLRASGTAGNSIGLNALGQGSAAGFSSTGGATGQGANFVGGATSGAGLRAAGTAGNSNGFDLFGQGSGDGMMLTGGATGNGLESAGGATSGDGIKTTVVSGNLITGSLSGSVNSVVTAVTTTYQLKKNTALSAFPFVMTDATTHLPKTGATVTMTISKNGAAFGASTNSPAEIGSGAYDVDLAAADTNANTLIYKFTATGCDVTLITIITQT